MTEPGSARGLRSLAGLGLTLGAALVLSRAFLFDLRTLASSSMLPGYGPGDLVLVWRLGEPEPGDVVLHRLGDDPERYVKRVVAVGGETVELVDGRLWVDGQPVGDDEASAARVPLSCAGRDEPVREERRGEHRWVVLPGRGAHPAVDLEPDQLWVLGDDRDRSRDSRHWGPVSRAEVEGVVVARLGRGGDCLRSGA